VQRAQVVDRLRHLVEVGEELAGREHFEEEHFVEHVDVVDDFAETWVEKKPARYVLPDELLPRYKQWHLSCTNLLGVVFGAQSRFYREFEDSERVALQVAVLKSALDEFEGGFVRPLIIADIFDSILDQAEELLTKGYYHAAAILGRVALEQTLREMADRHNVPQANNPKTKASVLNQGLWKEGVYEQPMWRQVDAWLDIGNAAAHGNWDKYGIDQVRGMLDGIRLFIATVS